MLKRPVSLDGQQTSEGCGVPGMGVHCWANTTSLLLLIKPFDDDVEYANFLLSAYSAGQPAMLICTCNTHAAAVRLASK